MKAMAFYRYGSSEEVALVEAPKPVPGDRELLVQVFATTVNRTDSAFRNPPNLLSRFWSGLFRPKFNILGCEFSGKVIQTGKHVHRFQPGDRVFGYNDATFGGHAEYTVISENAAVELLPHNLSYYQAAPLTEGAHYALCNIRAARVQPGQAVLVYGATGAIGSAAVQLLKHFGAKVTAVCNSANVNLVKNLGADTVIDYQKQNFTQTAEKFHFIFDAAGKSSFRVCRKLLDPKGIYISTEPGKNGIHLFLALFTPLFRGKSVLFPIPSIQAQDLTLLRQLAENNEFIPVIDRYYFLEEISDAYKYVETGRKTGNVIIKVH